MTDPADSLILLGTGTPNADPGRWGPALAVVVDGDPWIVDCGPGVVRRAVEAGLEPEALSRLLITHLHSDHTVGLPDLLLSPWVLGREEPLRVWGPPGTEELARHVQRAYAADVAERRDGLQPATAGGWRPEVTELPTGGVFYDRDGLRLEAFPVDHGSWTAYGYVFSTSRRRIVISADTAPCEALIEAARGCDVLVHEVYSERGLEARPPDWRAYHRAVHTSSRQLAGIANLVRPGLLVLYHQLFWGVGEEELLGELREFYDGRVVSGRDLDVY
jgi:ribonuclease BN (tRNA processing enzyme)